MSDNRNPYGAAADAYGAMAGIADQRSLEGKILLKAATKLDDLASRIKNEEKVSVADIGETLEYNQKLWQLFVGETRNEDHPLPQDIKNNIATLGVFVFKRTLELLIDTNPDKIQALVEINRNIAAGLMKKPQVQIPVPGTLAGKKPQDRAQEKPTPEAAKTDSLA